MDVFSVVFYGMIVLCMATVLLWLPINYLLWAFTVKDRPFLEWLGRIK